MLLTACFLSRLLKPRTVILLQEPFHVFFSIKNLSSQFDKGDSPHVAIVLQRATVDMQQTRELAIRQVAMPAEQGPVLFPQGIYPFYHSVAGTEKAHDFFIVLCFYIITHTITLDLVVEISLIMARRIAQSAALHPPVCSTSYTLSAYRVTCDCPDRFAACAD